MTGQNDFVSLFDVLFFLFVLILILSILKNNKNIFLPKDDSLLLMLMLYLLIVISLPFIGVVFHGYGFSRVTPSIRYFQWFLFLPIVVYLYVYEGLEHEHIILSLGIAAVSQTGYGLLQYIEHYEMISSLPHHTLLEAHTDRTDYNTRSIGFFRNPNRYGILMSFFGLIFSSLYIQGRKCPFLYLTLVSLLGVVLSGSRTALIAFLIPLIVYFIFLFGRLQSLFKFTTIVAIPILGIVFLSSEYISGGRFSEMYLLLRGDISEVSTLVARFENWNAAIDAYQTHSPTLVFRDVTGTPTDNYYLSILIQAGFIGPIVIVLMYLSIILWSLRIHFNQQNVYSDIVIVITLSILLANLTMSAFASPFTQILFWTYLGFLTATVQANAQKNK
ncbi:O-antigen ligase family protein [Natrialba sp. SSL1]|uniref:O-antigen ligase family protein n=1 Tax=Natrialba sp. SSL1 TaxID=1869245 RepID=UPI0014961150|nr:O-antigen ligase family protein [Natrialba sp. SSL1]